MKIEHPKGTESAVSKNTKSNMRRTFLKRASATAVVGVIPAKSVWATGITNSIVASGHGSDFADGRDIKLLSPCSILTLLSANTDASLDLNFSLVFGEIPNKTFSEILACHCSCPDETTNLDRAISNVVFLTEQGKQFKINYDRDGIKDPGHPAGYYSYIESQGSGKVIEFVTKTGGGRTAYYNEQGEKVSIGSPSWFSGHSGSHITEVTDNTSEYSSFSTAGVSCEGDETTTAMIAIYLNARFDLYFRGSTATENWGGSHEIYYPILTPTADVGNLVASIKASKNQLIDILSQYGAIDPPPSCL
jgi:hypothetical protein